MSKSKVLYGNVVIKVIEVKEGKFFFEQCYVVLKEGYVDGDYFDYKGIFMRGVGQIGKYRYMMYKEVFFELEEECKKFIFVYFFLFFKMCCVIMFVFYRGDI